MYATVTYINEKGNNMSSGIPDRSSAISMLVAQSYSDKCYGMNMQIHDDTIILHKVSYSNNEKSITPILEMKFTDKTEAAITLEECFKKGRGRGCCVDF
jgi:hypothetical protein